MPREVKKARLKVIEAIHAESAGARNRVLLGQTVEVLVEREEDGHASGRTRGGRIVHFRLRRARRRARRCRDRRGDLLVAARAQRAGARRDGDLLLTVV